MTTDTLKPHAKRLRAAIASMLNVEISHSQSLELVAREENYPNWDAASASLGKSRQVYSPEPTVQTRITVQAKREVKPSLASIFGHDKSLINELTRLGGLPDAQGALILIGAPTWHGKTTTADVLLSELFGKRTINPATLDDQAPELPPRFSVKKIDEIRTEEDAFQAVALAAAGVNVVATIHATDGINRLRRLLLSHGAGEVLLNQLLRGKQVASVQQELTWDNEVDRQERLKERQEDHSSLMRSLIQTDPDFVLRKP